MKDFIELIPSKDVREHIKKSGRSFTDFEKAAIIYHLNIPFEESHSMLKELMKTTQDELLKEQLRERIEYDEAVLEVFRSETTGYVYAVNSYMFEEPYICGYFANAALAHERGVKQKCRFDIRKYQIIGANHKEAIKPKAYANPYVFKNWGLEELIEEYEYDGEAVAKLCFNHEGELIDFYSSEIEHSNQLEYSFDPARFENAYIDIPNPFEQGDIVKVISTNRYGVVETSQAEWLAYNERMKNMAESDCFDASITVEMFGVDGEVSHEHINPMFMEKDDSPDEWYKDILKALSKLLKGEWHLDMFIMHYEEYKEKCERYWKSVKATGKPISLNRQPYTVDIRALIKYAEEKGIEPASLSSTEKSRFVKARKRE